MVCDGEHGDRRQVPALSDGDSGIVLVHGGSTIGIRPENVGQCAVENVQVASCRGHQDFLTRPLGIEIVECNPTGHGFRQMVGAQQGEDSA